MSSDSRPSHVRMLCLALLVMSSTTLAQYPVNSATSTSSLVTPGQSMTRAPDHLHTTSQGSEPTPPPMPASSIMIIPPYSCTLQSNCPAPMPAPVPLGRTSEDSGPTIPNSPTTDHSISASCPQFNYGTGMQPSDCQTARPVPTFLPTVPSGEDSGPTTPNGPKPTVNPPPSVPGPSPQQPGPGYPPSGTNPPLSDKLSQTKPLPQPGGDATTPIGSPSQPTQPSDGGAGQNGNSSPSTLPTPSPVAGAPRMDGVGSRQGIAGLSVFWLSSVLIMRF